MLNALIRSKVLCVLCGIYAVISAAAAEELWSDGARTRNLIGSWTVSKDSPELMGLPALPHYYVGYFHSDGTGQTITFADSSCRVAKRATTFTWAVKEGLLIERGADGSVSKDRIQKMSDNFFALYSAADSVVEYRTRVPDCRVKKTS
jgi:hypothetical protein